VNKGQSVTQTLTVTQALTPRWLHALPVSPVELEKGNWFLKRFLIGFRLYFEIFKKNKFLFQALTKIDTQTQYFALCTCPNLAYANSPL
jgi:hypothetical protein